MTILSPLVRLRGKHDGGRGRPRLGRGAVLAGWRLRTTLDEPCRRWRGSDPTAKYGGMASGCP